MLRACVTAFALLACACGNTTTPAQPTQQQAQQQRSAYDLTQLHPDVRRAVVQARRLAEGAESAASRARSAAQLAEQAAISARSGATGFRAYDFGNDPDNGRRYEGAWDGARQVGYGVLIYGRGAYAGDRYSGEFNNGFNGVGVYAYAENAANASGALRYEGEMVDDRSTGLGVFYWRDGQRYAGANRDWQSAGHGIIFRIDGTRYEGEWRADKRSGYGVEWDAEGRLHRQGVWRDGDFVTSLAP